MTNTAFDTAQPYPPITAVEGVDEKIIHEFVRLHRKVLAGLDDGQKHFVRPRTAPDIRAHFRAGHAGVVAMSGRFMVGQLLLARPDGRALKNLAGYPLGDDIQPEDALTLQAVGVHPSWRKGDLAKRLLDAACGYAARQGRGWVLGKTAADNAGGIATFKKAGFRQIGAAGMHGADSYASVFMARAVPALQVIEGSAQTLEPLRLPSAHMALRA